MTSCFPGRALPVLGCGPLNSSLMFLGLVLLPYPQTTHRSPGSKHDDPVERGAGGLCRGGSPGLWVALGARPSPATCFRGMTVRMSVTRFQVLTTSLTSPLRFQTQESLNPNNLEYWMEDIYTPGYDSLLKRKEAEFRRAKVCKIAALIAAAACTVILVIVVPICTMKS